VGGLPSNGMEHLTKDKVDERDVLKDAMVYPNLGTKLQVLRDFT
jgi:hypothetical protein